MIRRLLHRLNLVHGPVEPFPGWSWMGRCKTCGKIADFDRDPWSMGYYNWREQ